LLNSTRTAASPIGTYSTLFPPIVRTSTSNASWYG
jgi:hypothetical protein